MAWSLALGTRQVHSVSIAKDSSTGLSKGFGFVKYMSKESADKAKATLNGTPLKDFPELKACTCSLHRDLPALAGCGYAAPVVVGLPAERGQW